MVNAAGALCALVFCFQAVLAQPTDSSLPPEDLDSSGDDYDSFSGSGGDLLAIDLSIPLQESTNTSLMSRVPVDFYQPEVQQTDSSPTEHYSSETVSSTTIPLAPSIDLETDKIAVAVDDKLDSFYEQTTTKSPVATTRIPVTHHISTVRITTSQVSATHFVEPEVYHDLHHISSIDDKTPALDFVPTSERSLDSTSPTTTSAIIHNEISSLPEEEVVLTDDGSGIQEDFTFVQHDRNGGEQEPDYKETDSDARGAKSAGTPQGIMDRKEVLGGVIAGGVVGLLFAGFLVGFMLYRMKKKDEGSYSLDEPKQSNGGYQKPQKQEEFYA